MKYDDGSYHVGYAPSEAHAAAHIGLYFRWCLGAGLLSEDHTGDPELAEQLESILQGRLTATEYLWKNSSGKLSDVDLTEEANRFTRQYLRKQYLEDLRRITGKPDYQFTEAEVEFSRLEAILDERLDEWRRTSMRRPWWRFWAR
jgi:hypothetical protein